MAERNPIDDRAAIIACCANLLSITGWCYLLAFETYENMSTFGGVLAVGFTLLVGPLWLFITVLTTAGVLVGGVRPRQSLMTAWLVTGLVGLMASCGGFIFRVAPGC
jgi:hypothetical protein